MLRRVQRRSGDAKMRPWLRQEHPFSGEWLIRLKLEPLDEGGYVATSPDLQGLLA